MSLQISEKTRLGPDLPGRTSGSDEWVKVVWQEPGHQIMAEEATDVMVGHGFVRGTG